MNDNRLAITLGVLVGALFLFGIGIEVRRVSLIISIVLFVSLIITKHT